MIGPIDPDQHTGFWAAVCLSELPMARDRSMNIYITSKHRRPFLYGTTNTDIEVARALGFEIELFIHPGGRKEWAVNLRRHDDPFLLEDWQPVSIDMAANEGISLQRHAFTSD